MHIPVAHKFSLNSRGDTIVEVLIAIAIVSLILSGAYVTTNRSLQATRSAQERAIALKLAESQIEQLKGLVASNPTLIFGGSLPSPFCISKTTGQPVGTANPDCAVDTTGSATTAEPKYNLSITKTGNDFALTETWYDVNGQSTDNLQLRYRLYD